MAFFVALAPNEGKPVVEVDVGNCHADDLAPPNASVEHEPNKHPIAETEKCLAVERFHYEAHVVDCEG